MVLRVAQWNLKARNPAAVGRFWAEALGWTVFAESPVTTAIGPAGFVWPDPVTACIDVVAVGEPERVEGRVHLDLATSSAAHQAELVARLTDLGATHADVGQGDVPWTVLADPEGTLFCVLEPRAVYRDTGPIAAAVVDCADPRVMAGFWGAATGWTPHEVTDELVRLRSPAGSGPYLELLRTSGARSNGKRFHLDLLPGSGGDIARLRELGATGADVGQGEVPWTVLADPEGNEFCVLAPPAETPRTGTGTDMQRTVH